MPDSFWRVLPTIFKTFYNCQTGKEGHQRKDFIVGWTAKFMMDHTQCGYVRTRSVGNFEEALICDDSYFHAGKVPVKIKSSTNQSVCALLDALFQPVAIHWPASLGPHSKLQRLDLVFQVVLHWFNFELSCICPDTW